MRTEGGGSSRPKNDPDRNDPIGFVLLNAIVILIWLRWQRE